MNMDKTLLTLTTLRDGLKILWKPAMKCYTHSINSLFINAWSTRSFAIQNAVDFHKILKYFYGGIIHCQKFKVSTLCGF